MTAPKKDWAPCRWEIRTASCAIAVTGTIGGAISWYLSVADRPGLGVSGLFQSSGNLNTDLKTAQTDAVAALNAYAKTVTSYAAEVSAL